MTLPVAVRVNVLASFPTQVNGSSFIKVTKANGIWSIAPDYTVLAPLLPGFDPTAWFAAVENTTTKQFGLVSISQISSSLQNVYREITAAGDVTVGATDIGFLMNKTVGAATNIDLPLANSRNGVPVWVKDFKGDSNVNNITFVMAGADTLDGFTQAQANANGRSKLALAYGTKEIWPRAAGGWYIR